MTKFVNAFTGGEMWVADNRAEEYEAAGHRPVAFPAQEKPALVEKMEQLTENIKQEAPDEESKKKTVKKTTRKATKK